MSDLSCSHCQSASVIKSGVVRQRQRYRCRDCRRHFSLGWSPQSTAGTRALAISLYLDGAPVRRIAKWSGYSHVAVLKWIRRATADLPAAELPGKKERAAFNVRETEHFTNRKTKKLDLFEMLENDRSDK